ncbi:hypothetical protein Trydic_g22815 [Trypoxylus dichotomus]
MTSNRIDEKPDLKSNEGSRRVFLQYNGPIYGLFIARISLESFQREKSIDCDRFGLSTNGVDFAFLR